MLKKFWIGLATVVISISASFAVFAGEWKQDEVGWWYDFGDATYAKDGWHWVEGKCYYFTPDGYCLLNTMTPDGYTVDASGAWIVDGVVQIQDSSAADQTVDDGNVYQIENITFTLPVDYVLYEQDGSTWNFVHNNMIDIFSISSDPFETSDGNSADEAYINEVLDEAMQRLAGVWDSRKTVELTSGRWRAYEYYDENQYFDKYYMRIKNHRLDIIIFSTKDPNIDKDAFMNQYVC